MNRQISANIQVEGLRFHIKKGLYDTEKLVENAFTLSASVSYTTESIEAGAYLNYEQLASICSLEMHNDIHLLETIAENILSRIVKEWPFCTGASVKIQKHNPAFSGMELGAVCVEMSV